MYDLQIISSVFVLTVNIVTSMMLWIFRKGSRSRTTLALVATVVAVWNLFAVLLMPELRFDRLNFYYEMTGVTMGMLVYIYLQVLMEQGSDIRRGYKKVLFILCIFFGAHTVIRLFQPGIYLHSYQEIGSNICSVQVWLRIVVACFYIVLYSRLILGFFLMYSKHKKRIAQLYSYREKVNLSWIPVVGVLFIVYGMASTIDIFFAKPGSMQVVIFNFFFAGFYLVIFFLGASQQDVFSSDEIEWIKTARQNAEEQTVIPAGVRKKIKVDLLRLMEVEKVFLDPDLRLETMAQKLGTNRTYLSSVINEDFGQNFFVFVNKYRIREAQQIMQSPEGENRVTAIAEMVGFKSHSSFLEFFKRFSGMTPREFFRERT